MVIGGWPLLAVARTPSGTGTTSGDTAQGMLASSNCVGVQRFKLTVYGCGTAGLVWRLRRHCNRRRREPGLCRSRPLGATRIGLLRYCPRNALVTGLVDVRGCATVRQFSQLLAPQVLQFKGSS